MVDLISITSNNNNAVNDTFDVKNKWLVAHGDHGSSNNSVYDSPETNPPKTDENKPEPTQDTSSIASPRPVTPQKPVSTPNTEVTPKPIVPLKSQQADKYPNTYQQQSSVSKLIDAYANGALRENFTQDEWKQIKEAYINDKDQLPTENDAKTSNTGTAPDPNKPNSNTTVKDNNVQGQNQPTNVPPKLKPGEVPPLPATKSPNTADPKNVYNPNAASTGDYMIVYDLKGDGTGKPEKGKVLLDRPVVPANIGEGAKDNLPWLNKDANGNFNGTFSEENKVFVKNQDDKIWEGKSSFTETEDKIIIETNSLPLGKQKLATFGIRKDSEAYSYDTNPTGRKEQNIKLIIPKNPKIEGKAYPTSTGSIGVLIDGSILMNALDEKGKGARANECTSDDGDHTQQGGLTHRHCIPQKLLDKLLAKDPTKTGIVGYASDGIPITGPGTGKNKLFTKDLDAYHSITGWYKNQKGDNVYGRHYVSTDDFPNVVGAFIAKPNKFIGYSEPKPPQAPPNMNPRRDPKDINENAPQPNGAPSGDVPPKTSSGSASNQTVVT